ncbi:MAG: ABC transporter substrate-binding protein [Propionibacteriaceae bacterium]|jgi:peptide/nickel transport system substrate-binding protein|nr:ABC transporter substrate-binding protein [Propionibacteriaceae bacterium]
MNHWKNTKILSVALLPAFLLAGCGGSTDTGSGDGDAPAADGAKNVTVVIATEPANVEPCNAENGGVKVLRFNVIEPLTDLDRTSREAIPHLATSWERVDPTTWVFQIREGVTFHDGEALDAEAVVFGLNRALNNETVACSNTAKISAGVELTPEATGQYEVTITTNQPDPILDRELSFVDLVSPNTPADAETDTPIGTGPYTWAAWNRTQDIQLARYDGYWGAAPEADTVKLIFRVEDSQRANAVTTGEADIAFHVSDANAPEGDDTKVYTQDARFILRLPVKVEPFTDQRVRDAVRHAIDRESIAAALLGRTGEPADQLVADSNNGYDPKFTAPDFDPAKAQELLDAAKADGVDTSKPVDLTGMEGQFAGSNEVYQAIAQNLQESGFTVNLKIVDAEEWKKQLFRDTASADAATILGVKHDNPFGDASSSFTSYMYGGGCCGTADDAQMDGLITRGMAAEGAERQDLFQQAAHIEYAEEISLVGVSSLNAIMMLSDKVSYEPDALTDRFHGIRMEWLSFR